MTKPIRLTKHARQKLVDLAILGFVVSEAQIIDALENPDKVDQSVSPFIAQKSMGEKHVLRVVFAEEEVESRVITFYRGRRTRYEP